MLIRDKKKEQHTESINTLNAIAIHHAKKTSNQYEDLHSNKETKK